MKKLLGVFVVLVLLMPLIASGEEKWVEPTDLIASFPPGIGTALFYVGSIHYLISYQTSIYYSAYVDSLFDSRAVLEKKVKASVTFGTYVIKNIPITCSSIDLKFRPRSILITGDTENVENLPIRLEILEIGKEGAMKIRVEELR